VSDTRIHQRGAQGEGVHEFESRTRPGIVYRSDGRTCSCPARGTCWHQRVARVRIYKANKRRTKQVEAMRDRARHEDMSPEARLELLHEVRVAS
jgi:hypothetical protein